MTYYVTTIVIRNKGEMTFRNDLIEYDPLTKDNIQAFQKKIKGEIHSQEKAMKGSKLLNVVISGFSKLEE